MPKSSFISLNWKIAGEAGDGVMLSSKLLAKACKRQGLNAFNYLEYPSLIKGGHQTGQVYASATGGTCQHRILDLLVTFNPNCFTINKNEINKDTLIVYNSDTKGLTDAHKKMGKKVIEIPLFKLAMESAGIKLAANVVALGVSAYFLGLDSKIFEEMLADEFKGKEKIIESNRKAYEAGFKAAKESGVKPLMTVPTSQDKQILLNGNEAIAMGAIAGGVGYYSAYPMTPATHVLHTLAEAQFHYPIVVKHVEDEISAINQAIGASIAGVRAMTGSSGGGFALMVEGVSYAGIAEVPLVIVEAMRKGPATGLPTWTEQADLAFILTAGHGDFPKIVLTPGTVEEHFTLTKKAFYLAEKYQCPVFVITDKFIAESHQTMPKPELKHHNERYSMVKEAELKTDNSYLRYKLSTDGISKRSIPGQAHGLGVTNSYEHDEFGFATEEASMTQAQVEKRAKKEMAMLKEIPEPELIGPKDAPVTFVSWGSTINVTQEAVLMAKGQANAIHLACLKPFPAAAFSKLTQKAKKLVMVEANSSGQVERLIRQETGLTFADHIRRYDGRPFYSEDLLDYLKK